MRGMADDELGALSGALNMASNVATAFKVTSHKQGNTVSRSKDKSDRASVEQVARRRPAQQLQPLHMHRLLLACLSSAELTLKEIIFESCAKMQSAT